MNLGVRKGRPVRRDDVWLRRAGAENALFDPETGKIHLVNATALAIWNLCDGETRPDEMIDAIVDLCNTHPDIVTEDVGRILDEFEIASLIQWESDDAGDEA
jgi:hypothetical protein